MRQEILIKGIEYDISGQWPNQLSCCEAHGKGRAKGRLRKVTQRSFIDYRLSIIDILSLKLTLNFFMGSLASYMSGLEFPEWDLRSPVWNVVYVAGSLLWCKLNIPRPHSHSYAWISLLQFLLSDSWTISLRNFRKKSTDKSTAKYFRCDNDSI